MVKFGVYWRTFSKPKFIFWFIWFWQGCKNEFTAVAPTRTNLRTFPWSWWFFEKLIWLWYISQIVLSWPQILHMFIILFGLFASFRICGHHGWKLLFLANASNWIDWICDGRDRLKLIFRLRKTKFYLVTAWLVKIFTFIFQIVHIISPKIDFFRLQFF